LRRAVAIAQERGLLGRYGALVELGRLYGVTRQRVSQIAGELYPDEPRGTDRRFATRSGFNNVCGRCQSHGHNVRSCDA
jgi:hypothetical protein